MKLKNIGYAVFVAATAAAFVGSGGPSEAKHKKKMEAAPPPGPCFVAEKRVCAVKGGMKFTYASACIAAKDGAKVVSQKACPVKAAKKGGKKKAAKKPAKK
jgi:hypothetical protein